MTGKVLVAVVCVVFSASCIGLTGGRISTRKFGFEVERELAVGMGKEEALTILAEGGAIGVPGEFARGNAGAFKSVVAERANGLEDAVRELERAKVEDHSIIDRICVIDRGSGFFGYDVFYLFLDAEGRLVSHTWHHYN